MRAGPSVALRTGGATSRREWWGGWRYSGTTAIGSILVSIWRDGRTRQRRIWQGSSNCGVGVQAVAKACGRMGDRFKTDKRLQRQLARVWRVLEGGRKESFTMHNCDSFAPLSVETKMYLYAKVARIGLCLFAIFIGEGCRNNSQRDSEKAVEALKRQGQIVDHKWKLPDQWRYLSYGGTVYITRIGDGQVVVFRNFLGRGKDFVGYMYADGVGPFKTNDNLRVLSPVPRVGVVPVEVSVISVVKSNWYGIATDHLD